MSPIAASPALEVAMWLTVVAFVAVIVAFAWWLATGRSVDLKVAAWALRFEGMAVMASAGVVTGRSMGVLVALCGGVVAVHVALMLTVVRAPKRGGRPVAAWLRRIATAWLALAAWTAIVLLVEWLATRLP